MDNSMYDTEIEGMAHDRRMDALRAEEYKNSIARQVSSASVKDMFSITELNPKPRKKPFRIRVSEFIRRLADTLR